MSMNGDNVFNLEDEELDFDNTTAVVEYLKKNLAQLLVDTEKVKVELDKFQKAKKLLLEHTFSSLMPDVLEPLPEDVDLLPRINQVTLQAEELLNQLTNLSTACDQHSQENVMNVTAKELMSCTDQDRSMSTEDLEKLIEESKLAMQQNLLKGAIKQKELADKRKAWQAKHLALVQQMESMNLAERSAIDFLAQMIMGIALDKEDPTE